MSAVFAETIVGRYIQWAGDTWQVLAIGAHPLRLRKQKPGCACAPCEAAEELDRLSAALRDIISAYERRSELFIDADDCAGNLADRARKALKDTP
jgi:hypothetical protein